MPAPEELMLKDLHERYANIDVEPEFSRLYSESDVNSRMFAYFQQRLNRAFDFMNYKAGTNRHFNAEDSRQLLNLMEDIQDAQDILRRVGIEFTVADEYQAVLDRCSTFLVPSGGSPIPEDFEKIRIVKYEPVFVLPETRIHLAARQASFDLQPVASGSCADVFRYLDPAYDIMICLKRAKSSLGPKDLERFRNEFQLLKSLRFPYLLQVFKYNDDRNEYTMEYCDMTPNDFIGRNPRLSFSTRKRIGLQFLFGMNYLHSKRYLHRDLSYMNVLVKQFDLGAVILKISDFGLVKDPETPLTRTGTEIRGTILDPTLTSFKDYDLKNEIYAIGVVLSFIFSGQRHIGACTGDVQTIIETCVRHDVSNRYADVRAIIGDVELLTDPAGT